jgi:hypothetical protein
MFHRVFDLSSGFRANTNGAKIFWTFGGSDYQMDPAFPANLPRRDPWKMLITKTDESIP